MASYPHLTIEEVNYEETVYRMYRLDGAGLGRSCSNPNHDAAGGFLGSFALADPRAHRDCAGGNSNRSGFDDAGPFRITNSE
jgi:hypothetical protein